MRMVVLGPNGFYFVCVAVFCCVVMERGMRMVVLGPNGFYSVCVAVRCRLF